MEEKLSENLLNNFNNVILEEKIFLPVYAPGQSKCN